MTPHRSLVTLLLICAVVSGCSSVKPWRNSALAAEVNIEPQHGTDKKLERDPSILVAVTLSGGGARAAAFAYGVLQEMRNTNFVWNGEPTDLLNATDVVSGVSGGSIIAAYLAAFGKDGLSGFEEDFLRKNFQNNLILQAFRPGNMWDLSSSWFGRSDLLARRLDTLYRGMTYGDIEQLPRHPQLLVTATDMTLGAGFEFTADQFAMICSDIRSVPLAYAVAASSAVPLLLTPITLVNYSDQCKANASLKPVVSNAQPNESIDYHARLYRAQQQTYLDSKTRPYLHLVDGGLSDNLGIRRLLDRALAEGGLRSSFREVNIPPGSVRKMIIITVNAERDPSNSIDASDEVPGFSQVIDTLVFGAGAKATHETQEFLADLAREWRLDIKKKAGGFDAFASDAQIHVVQVNLRDAPGIDNRRSLLKIPTAFSISDDEVTMLIEAGHDILKNSKQFQELQNSLK